MDNQLARSVLDANVSCWPSQMLRKCGHYKKRNLNWPTTCWRPQNSTKRN